MVRKGSLYANLVVIGACFTLMHPSFSKALQLASTAAAVLPRPGAAAAPEWNPSFDDDEECVIPSEESTVEHILNEPAQARALEIARIVLSKMLVPLGSSMLQQGVGDDWEEFWTRTHPDGTSNGDHFTDALEELGVCYVKFGQALAARPDAIPLSLANSLSKLQDCALPFDAESAKRIVTQELFESNKLTPLEMEELRQSLSEAPIAAASVGQVYKAKIGNKEVAVKIQRPGIRDVMERDAALLRTVANWVESIPAPAFLGGGSGGDRLVASELEDAVEGFFERVFEELDYKNEMANADKFASLYSHRGGTSDKAHVVVPEFYPDLCTDHVLVMEWLEGTKLTCIDEKDPSSVEENLEVIKQAIDCTLSQLLDTGVLHADPHGGNLLKIQTPQGSKLGYLDFGLMSSVPQSVRDALVCAVVHLVFDQDSEAVAMLFGELQLVPQEVIEDPEELKALTEALNQTMNNVLVYPEYVPGKVQFPLLQIDKLVSELTKLVPRFKFQLPGYFLQKARALGYLEGMACSLDSDFNVLQMLYPYALDRLMVNPSDSSILDDTLQSLIRSPETGRVELDKISILLEESAQLAGFRKRKVVRDVLKTSGGRRLARKVVWEKIKDAPVGLRRILRQNKKAERGLPLER